MKQVHSDNSLMMGITWGTMGVNDVEWALMPYNQKYM